MGFWKRWPPQSLGSSCAPARVPLPQKKDAGADELPRPSCSHILCSSAPSVLCGPTCHCHQVQASPSRAGGVSTCNSRMLTLPSGAAMQRGAGAITCPVTPRTPGPPPQSKPSAIPRGVALADTSVMSHHWPLWIPPGAEPGSSPLPYSCRIRNSYAPCELCLRSGRPRDPEKHLPSPLHPATERMGPRLAPARSCCVQPALQHPTQPVAHPWEGGWLVGSARRNPFSPTKGR